MSDSELPTVGRARTAATGTARTEPAKLETGLTEPELAPAQTVLSRYRLIKQLGSGAFGSVWSARDERLQRDVAVKILPRGRVVHERFEREARAAARLTHPAIVTLYEAAVDDDGAYLVSELVRGRTLAALLEAGRLSDREIIEVGITIAGALEHAHRLGVIHRDVKPSNILVSVRGPDSLPRAKLADFGVAHVIDGETLTRTGEVVGTLAYMAPEQAEGRAATPSSDLYSLALVIYEALCGVNPLQGAYTGRLWSRRRFVVFVPPIRRQRRDLARGLAAGIDAALRPRPEARGTLDDLAAALRDALDGAERTRGVVAGWHGFSDPQPSGPDQPEPPSPLWRADEDAALDAAQPESERERERSAAARSAPDRRRPPRIATVAWAAPGGWVARAANAVAVAFGVVWCCVHLLHVMPLAPAALGLIAALVALLAPRLTCVLGALALGSVSLAGVFPALAGLIARRWRSRALLAGAGYLALLAGSAAVHHSLYWLPRGLARGELSSLTATAGLAGALIWAAAAALAPLARAPRRPLAAVALVTLWSLGTLAALEATRLGPLRGAWTGAALAALALAAPALAALAPALARGAGKTAPLA